MESVATKKKKRKEKGRGGGEISSYPTSSYLMLNLEPSAAAAAS